MIGGYDVYVSLCITGFLLGWSVAWPPGPVNAEIVRRGLARGFWAAYGMALGGCTGDAVWALIVMFGSSAVLGSAIANTVLRVASTCLLVVLAAHYLHGAWRSWVRARAGGELAFERSPSSIAPAGSARHGPDLDHPWNIAFWLAVGPVGAAHGLGGAFAFALAVVLGAATWALITSRRRWSSCARGSPARWDAITARHRSDPPVLRGPRDPRVIGRRVAKRLPG
jgi:threonine/homoserine/homoserine lactone efflux protein